MPGGHLFHECRPRRTAFCHCLPFRRRGAPVERQALASSPRGGIAARTAPVDNVSREMIAAAIVHASGCQADAAPACDRDSGLRSQPILPDRSQPRPPGNPDERGSARASDRHHAAAPAIAAVTGSDPHFSGLERHRRGRADHMPPPTPRGSEPNAGGWEFEGGAASPSPDPMYVHWVSWLLTHQRQEPAFSCGGCLLRGLHVSDLVSMATENCTLRGESSRAAPVASPIRVHPRVCGEAVELGARVTSAEGPSPRVRGRRMPLPRQEP